MAFETDSTFKFSINNVTEFFKAFTQTAQPKKVSNLWNLAHELKLRLIFDFLSFFPLKF